MEVGLNQEHVGREVLISPSLLACDYSRMGEEVLRVVEGGADTLHIDVMDGHFVPNLSFGPQTVRSIRSLTSLFFDVHLMCDRPEILLEPFCDAGADKLTVHVELDEFKPGRVGDLVDRIRGLGKKVGLAVNPPTDLERVVPYLGKIDLLLVMTVNPGFGGQSFIGEMTQKLERAEVWRKEGRGAYEVQVDGGINEETAAECARAGANVFVSGTALFRKPDMGQAIREMRARVRAAHPQETQHSF